MIVHMIGNAHIDPVWLWNWQQGVDEALATVRSAIDRCREYPEFIFTRGEAWIYQQIERIDPEMFAEIQSLVHRGQWHITGGQWIQLDVNLPTAEGLRRQMIHGRRYFQEKFGVRPDVGYNVDSFGHPATLPDLLAEQKYIGYVFHRPNQEQTPVPGATFRWRGVGGAEVLGYRIPAPYVTRSDDLYGQIMLSLDAADEKIGHIAVFYGVGNHGGGPTKGNIEYILNNRHAFQGAELQFSTPQRFFQEVGQARDKLPVVDFELQKTFPGCYIVMQDIKRPQRYNEHLLQQAEAVIDRWAPPAEKPGLTDRLDRAWEDLLFTEFHDILAGTSISPAWESVKAIQGRAKIAGEEIIYGVTRRWARKNLPPVNHQQIALLNPGKLAFDGLVEHEPFLDFDLYWRDRWLCTLDGEPIPYQHVKPLNLVMPSTALVFPARIEAGGATVLLLRDDAKPTAPPSVPGNLTASPTRLGNDQITVDLSPSGIQQITIQGKPCLGADGITLHLREDAADTWGFHVNGFTLPVSDTLSDCRWVVAESGPLRAKVHADVTLGRSVLRWTLLLYHDRPRLDVRIDVTFAEHHKLLQMPVALRSAPKQWRAGLAGGAVTREPGTVEWPLQGWAYPLCEPALGMVTQEVNSASLLGQTFTWSLVRGSLMASGAGIVKETVGPDTYTDQGTHRFNFQFLPITPGPAAERQLLDASVRRVQPPIVFDRYEGLNRPPWGNNPGRMLWTPAEHRARKDGRMMHLVDDRTKSVEEKKEGQ